MLNDTPDRKFHDRQSCERKFEDYKQALRGRYGVATYESWFKMLVLDDYEEERVIISAPSQFTAKQICERFSEDMVDIWREKCGPVQSFQVRGGNGGIVASVPVRRKPSGGMKLVANKGIAAREMAAANDARRPVAQLRAVQKEEAAPQQAPEADPGLNIAAPLNATLSFERFCVSDCNRLAQAAANSVLENETTGVVYYHGGPGRGKTHLLNSIGLEWLNRRPGDKVLYLTYDNLLNGYVTAVMSKNLPELRAYLDQIDLLMVDDVHMLRGRKATQEELLTLIDRLVAKGGTVIVAGSMAPSALAETGLNHRLTDRLGGGLAVQMDKPDFGLRLKILRQMADYDCTNNRVCVEERYLQMIARRCDASIREIEGAYRSIRLRAETCQRSSDAEPMSDAYVLSVLQEMQRFRKKEFTLDDLMSAVADAFGLSVADLKSRRRPQTIVKGRHAFCLLARKLTDAPLKEIGACLNRDHTTVLSSLDRGEVLAETSPEFGERISRLMDEFGD
ncbi:ATP-binding protein [Parvularcula flava]|uniref:Chromosomal replication initiator protein DnaA n=1 Tax=Aquisalinus luteolus TaxID=1566827 RepID=A0A8J3ESR2_9PROT|nr:DnaA/Hda family protein [Aquisalinus luteolus]NHK29424.1 ATP-binding protein [Aquisalinus luteolus]GGI01990.1 chromosomal replication initiator protein DnaA [Aquisalinus luteolus]